jgi:DNA invertase Pin-like site-specific DNA recombinase
VLSLAPHSIAFIPRNTWVSVTNTTPAGRLMFNVIGAMAEFERALIQERVRAGVRNARAKGKRIGRPRIATDGRQVAALRKAGNLGVKSANKRDYPRERLRGRTTLRKVLLACPKTVAGLSLRAFESSF